MASAIRSDADESLRKYAMLGYAMHLFGLISVIGFLWLLIPRVHQARGRARHVDQSHFVWQTRSFWWGLLWFALLLIPTLLTIGFVPFFVIAQVWFAYRMIKGWLLTERRPRRAVGVRRRLRGASWSTGNSSGRPKKRSASAPARSR